MYPAENRHARQGLICTASKAKIFWDILSTWLRQDWGTFVNNYSPFSTAGSHGRFLKPGCIPSVSVRCGLRLVCDCAGSGTRRGREHVLGPGLGREVIASPLGLCRTEIRCLSHGVRVCTVHVGVGGGGEAFFLPQTNISKTETKRKRSHDVFLCLCLCSGGDGARGEDGGTRLWRGRQ